MDESQTHLEEHKLSDTKTHTVVYSVYIFHLYEVQSQPKIIYLNSNYNSRCHCTVQTLTEKGHKGTFWGDEYVLRLNWHTRCTGVYICQYSSTVYVTCILLCVH